MNANSHDHRHPAGTSTEQPSHRHHSSHEHPRPYWRLSVMAVLSFVAMYVLMYSMVDRPGNVYNNLNQAYMAGLMAAPMVLLELLLMRSMYRNQVLNGLIMAASVLLGVLFWVLIRQQGGITDRQFLRSMIPHHAGAVLMCEQRETRDARIRRLCDDITSSQTAEIRLMESWLAETGARESPATR